MYYVYIWFVKNSDIAVYVGITKCLKIRTKQHYRDDGWCKSNDFDIKYFTVNSRSSAEAWESHLIALYGTYIYENKAKSNLGIIDEFSNIKINLLDYIIPKNKKQKENIVKNRTKVIHNNALDLLLENIYLATQDCINNDNKQYIFELKKTTYDFDSLNIFHLYREYAGKDIWDDSGGVKFVGDLGALLYGIELENGSQIYFVDERNGYWSLSDILSKYIYQIRYKKMFTDVLYIIDELQIPFIQIQDGLSFLPTYYIKTLNRGIRNYKICDCEIVKDEVGNKHLRYIDNQGFYCVADLERPKNWINDCVFQIKPRLDIDTSKYPIIKYLEFKEYIESLPTHCTTRYITEQYFRTKEIA